MGKEYKDPMGMKDQWVMDVSDSVFPKYKEQEPMTAFVARSGSKRPTPHKKINECDH